VTSLPAGAFGVWFLTGEDSFLFSKIPPPVQCIPSSFPRHKLATHLHLVPRLRISRAVHLLLLCAFVVWLWVYYGTWVFITVFTTAQYWMVLRASTVQSIYAYTVCWKPSFQVSWFTFCTLYLISQICVTCLSCPWLLRSHKCCNFGLDRLFLYAITAFLG
jgi:hypothetical protein